MASISYGKEDKRYLGKYAEVLVKGNFGESLEGFPKNLRRLTLKAPNTEKVDSYLQELFFLELN